MAHGVVMADGLDRIVVVNRRFCDFYGFDPEAIAPGCAYRDLIVLDVAAGITPDAPSIRWWSGACRNPAVKATDHVCAQAGERANHCHYT